MNPTPINSVVRRVQRRETFTQQTASPRYVLRFTFDPSGNAQQEYVIGHDDQLPWLPAGATVSTARIADGGIPAISQQIDFRKSTAAIAAPTFVIADIDSAFSNLLALKWRNRISVRYILVELFRHSVGDPLNFQRHREHTFLVERADYDKGAVLIRCADIGREMIKAQILEPIEWTLTQSILTPREEGTPEPLIYLEGTKEDLFFQHSDAYPAHPGKRVFYLQTPEDEVIAVDILYPDRSLGHGCSVLERGCFNTRPKAVEVNREDSRDNWPTITEHIYLVETPSAMLLALLTGTTPDNRSIPVHWSRGIADWADPRSADVLLDSADYARRTRWVNSASFAAADHLRFPLTLQAPGSAKLKDFVEKQVLATLPGVMVPDAEGRLELLIDEPLLPDQAVSMVFTEDDVDLETVSGLQFITSDLGNPVQILSGYDWRSDTFRNQPILYDVGAEELAGGPMETKTFEFKLLGGGFSTDAQRRKLAVIKSDSHAYPRQGFSFDARPFAPRARLGQVVGVDIPLVRNSYGGEVNATGLNRAFRVIGITGMTPEGKVRYTVEGGLGVAARRAQSQQAQYLDDAAYDALTPISSVIPLINGNELGGVHVIPPGDYGHSGNLRLRPDLRVTFSEFGRRFLLAVRGELICESPNPFDGTGASVHGGGRGKTQTGFWTFGSFGYFGTPAPEGAIYFQGKYDYARKGGENPEPFDYARRADNIAYPVQPYLRPGIHRSSVPDFALAYNNGQLTGLPTDLSGSGGRGADGHTLYVAPDERLDNPYNRFAVVFGLLEPQEFRHLRDGMDGGRGGMGLVFISRGGGFAGAGGMVTDGADAQIDTDPGNSIPRAAGAGGAPGVPAWLMDGPFTLADMSPSRISARFGAGSRTGRALRAGESYNLNTGGAAHSALISGTNGVNVAGAIAKSMYLPAPAVLQEPLSEIDEAFATQFDGLFVLHVTDLNLRPSNADDGDMAIWRPYAQGINERPEAWIYNAQTTIWERADWSSLNVVYSLMLGNYRATGATRFISSTTRPVNGTFSEGTLWFNPSNQVTARLRLDGPPDEQILRDGFSLGDNRYGDGTFIAYAQHGRGWIVTEDIDATPVFDVLPSAAEIAAVGVEPRYALDAVAFLNYLAQDTQVTLSWQQPSTLDGITGYEIRRDGVLLTTVNATRYTDTGVTGGEAYAYRVRAVGRNGARSADIGISAVTRT